MTENPIPAEALIVGDDGLPVAHVNLDQLQTDATLLMYEMAETAGDDDATNRVAEQWVRRHDPDYFGYIAAAALSLTVRNILGPTLDVCERAGVDLRPGLKRASAHAHRELAPKGN